MVGVSRAAHDAPEVRDTFGGFAEFRTVWRRYDYDRDATLVACGCDARFTQVRLPNRVFRAYDVAC